MLKPARVLVRVPPAPYPVYVGEGILDRLPAWLAPRVPGRRAIVVSDARLARSWGARVAAGFRRAGWRVTTLSMPTGEAAKSLAAIERLYGALLRAGAERRTPIVAVGGGAVGDAAGFAAATYYRGVPLVHVPTTLLAQVDSAIGGKTAVNHPLAKNAIGAFHQPMLTVADVATLRTLPERDFRAGMGEVVKYGLALDAGFARALLARWEDAVLRQRPAALAWLVRRCVALKAGVVAADERDLSGRRELLNFGHTLGHALEAATGYRRFRHGEAVAWGMRAAVALSRGRGWLRDAAGNRLLEALLARLPAVRRPRGLTPGALLSHLASDKKVAGGRNTFVLLRGLGAPVRVRDVSRAELLAALRQVP